MMALWMAYALALSLLFAAAARVGEKGLDLYGWPLRWVWAAAMAGAVVVPVAAYAAISGWAVGAEAGLGAGAGGAATVVADGASLPALASAELGGTGEAGLAERLRFLDPWLFGAWGLASLATAGWLLAGWLRLRARRRRWKAAEIDGVEVLISPDEGPAITGFLRGTILLPSWFEELDRDLRPLVLRHEREHLAVGDHRLLAGGLVAVALFPWNPALWWTLARLRQAMEIDCDRRVLGEGIDRSAYAELLVQMGERASRGFLPAAAFAGSSSLLERRIRNLAGRRPRRRIARAAFAVGTALALGGAIGWVPVPDEPVEVTLRSGEASTAPGPEATLPGQEVTAHGPEATAPGDRPARVVPPAPAVMRLDLRLYLAEEDPSVEVDGGPGERRLDMEAVRLAKQLSYACAPYLNGSAGPGGRQGGAGAAAAGCFVVVDGEPAHPSILREMDAGTVAGIEILPGDEAVERYGPEARRGAYVVRTNRG